MATLDTTGVIACMFDADATITVGAQTYVVPANQPIGIPDGVDSLTLTGPTKALCQTQVPKTYKVTSAGSLFMPALFINEVRIPA